MPVVLDCLYHPTFVIADSMILSLNSLQIQYNHISIIPNVFVLYICAQIGSNLLFSVSQTVFIQCSFWCSKMSHH